MKNRFFLIIVFLILILVIIDIVVFFRYKKNVQKYISIINEKDAEITKLKEKKSILDDKEVQENDSKGEMVIFPAEIKDVHYNNDEGILIKGISETNMEFSSEFLILKNENFDVINNEKKYDKSYLMEGQKIIVSFSGVIKPVFPAILKNVSKIEIIEE